MKYLLGSLLLLSCAPTNRYAYAEMDACPAPMSEEQHESGVVRCRAMCSSYARDFGEFDSDCKCRCGPSGGGQYQKPSQKTWGQTVYTPPRPAAQQ
jgi:hypothetical protein